MTTIKSYKDMENYELRHRTSIYDRIPISEYVSKKTGLTVIISEFDGPTIDISFHILTEAFDDDGLPNTLRYLIFMGSEDFPYKDPYLESNVTSKTGTVYTAYTISFFTSDGLRLLSIIGNYILFPLLTEEGFTTEVYHVTKEGEDAGLMYNDLQNSEECIVHQLHLNLLKKVYPNKCSYASNTQGTTKSLRESVNITKIRDYHKAFYRAENLKIVLTGNVKPQDVFEALEKLEEKILSKGIQEPFQRPFQVLPPSLVEPSTDLVIRYPADSRSNGYFYIIWRTVSCITDSYTLAAITMLLEYLTESPKSPLVKQFINIEESAVRHSVGYDIIRNEDSCVYIFFNNVPLDQLSEIKPKLQSIFEEIIQYKNIDMKCLETIITQLRIKQIICLENYPSHEVQNMAIRYMAFGNSNQDHRCFNPLPELDRLLEEPQSFWLAILKEYFLKNKNVSIQFIPSKKEKQNRSLKKQERIEAQKRSLTKSSLKEKGDVLEKAINLNSLRPPPELLISVPFPSIDCMRLHNIKRYNSDSIENQRIDLSQTPVFTYFDHVNATTVFLQAFLGTDGVPIVLQNYLPLLFECLMELPIEKNGKIISHENVRIQLDADITYRWTDPRSYCMPHLAAVCVEVEDSKYDIGFKWLSDILFKAVFTVERLKYFATQMLKELTHLYSFHDAISAMCFSKDSYLVACQERHQKKFLTDLLEKLDGDDSKQVLDDIEKVRRLITDPSKITLYIAANLDRLKNPVESINAFLPPEIKPSEQKQTLISKFNYDFLQFNDSLNGCIIGDKSVKYTQLCQVTKTVTSYIDPDYAALIVYIQYLGHAKGLLHQQQPEHFWFNVNVEEGLLYFTIPRVKNVEVYEKIKEIICNQLEGKNWNKSLLRNTQLLSLNELIEEESTIMDLVLASRKAYFHNLDYTYSRQIFDSVTRVTTDDLNRVGEKYIAPLFDPKKSKTAILTRPSKIKEYADGFKKLGLDLKVYDSIEASILNNL